MTRTLRLAAMLAAASLVAASCGKAPATTYEVLAEGFDNPPASSRPMTWWHWMNGNVTLDGISKDLHWLHDSGISGVFLFDAGMNTPQIVENRATYMSDGWQEALSHAIDVADSLGMDFHIASSPGWSLTGGPWVSEADAQKKLVWSTTYAQGGKKIDMDLPEPPSVSGPYQDEIAFKNDPDRYRYYQDLYVIALKTPRCDTARIVRSEVKAGFKMDYTVSDHFPTPDTDDYTDIDDVMDITECFQDGRLSWDAPDGYWKIFRMGCSLIGHINGPAPEEATGLEVDKLDRGAVQRYFQNYLALYDKASKGRFGAHGINGMVIDSYESGKSTWTPLLEQEFKARRGYDMRPWLPVLSGQIIGSAQLSERFLFDWRQTLGELLKENHYDQAGEILHAKGITRYNEAHEERTAFTGDGMAVKSTADVPMSAFWVRYNAGWYSLYPGCEADLREASSTADIYGQGVCAAESFTTNGRIGKWDGYGAYRCHPGVLKRAADGAMAEGLNRFVMHTSVHQPVDSIFPGPGLSTYGQWFTRHDTWASEAKVWTDYLARSCFMLQTGRKQADIAYFYGEDKNVTGRFYDERICLPRGWDYDFINADALLNFTMVHGGRLVTGSGMSFGQLVIDNELRYMSMPMLRQIAAFAREGVIITGPKPQAPANLLADEAEFNALAEEIWQLPNVTGISAPDASELCTAVEQSFLGNGIAQDVIGMPDSLRYVHREFEGTEIYWIANICSQARTVELSLRCSGLTPEIWHPDTGVREPASWSTDGSRTTVTLEMTPDDAQFIILSPEDGRKHGTAVRMQESTVAEIGGPWTIELHQRALEPRCLQADSLAPLNLYADPYIRYYSGTATYSCSFELDRRPEGRIVIDLGDVHNMARVIVNGKDMGLAWKRPHRLDITRAVKSGQNSLQVRVTNSWANRLIGDLQPENEKGTTWTAVPFYQVTDTLETSGLIGPVSIICQE